ncbi:MAG: sugar transferase [Ruminococcaceae bacterium]|nr:sugar transferase [Oscillospiraceae bacterium]
MDKKTKKNLALRTTKFLHLIVSTGLFCGCWWFFCREYFDSPDMIGYTVAGGLIFCVMILLLGRIYDIYSVGTARVSYLIYSHGLTFLITDALVYVIISLILLKLTNPIPILILFAAHMIWSVLWSIFENWLYFKVSPPRATVIVYDDPNELYKLGELGKFKRKFNVVKRVSASVGIDAVKEEIKEAEIVFLIGVELEMRSALSKECVVRGAQCYVMPRVGDILLHGADQMHTFSVPFLRVHGAVPTLEYLFIKRAFDIIASLLAIIITSPFMLITAIAIKVYDRGPVLYKQTRLTRGHKQFKVLKFRSMRVDAEKDGVARLSTEHDDRITPIGKIIRKIRFDELPQLFNILKGDMTIVGPRPERPEIAEQYEKEIPSFGLRLQVKAGLTGYAQVYGKYNTEPYDKLKMDLLYINNMCLGEDIRLMFATVKILFMPESTEGIADGQVTASHVENATTSCAEETERLEEIK